MNPSFNSIEIMGNVGKKPIISYLNNSTPVVRLRVCVNDRYTDKTTGQIKENTQWFSVLLYNKLAELAGEYLQYLYEALCAHADIHTMMKKEKYGKFMQIH